MTTVRLSNDLRDKIAKELMARAFDKREAALKQTEGKLAKDIYLSLYPAAVRRKMTSLGQHFFETTSHITVQAGGDFIRLNLPEAFDGKREQVLIGEHHSGYHHVMEVYDAKHEFTNRIRTLQYAKTKLKEDKEQARAEVRGALFSVSTVNRLIKVWPEVEPVVKKLVPTKSGLPALPIEALNSRFGLGENKA